MENDFFNTGKRHIHMFTIRKKGVLKLALQLNFWITKDICNSLYLYAMNSNGQVAWVAKLQSCKIAIHHIYSATHYKSITT